MIRGLNLRAALDNPAQPNLNESHIDAMLMLTPVNSGELLHYHETI